MGLPTAEQVTNKYLYGADKRPEDMLDPSIWRCCINQGRGEAVLTFTRNDMAVTL